MDTRRPGQDTSRAGPAQLGPRRVRPAGIGRPLPAALLAAFAVTFLVLALIASVALSAPGTADARSARGHGHHRHHLVQQCAEGPYSSRRDPSNPLALPVAPGADPLNGARFFVPGPTTGSAASAIARLLGIDPVRLPVGLSWTRFAAQLESGPLALLLASRPGLAHQVAELSKIAAEPEAQRLSSYSGGGGPGAIYAQAERVLCVNMTSDPGSIPLFNTYFLHPVLGFCPTPRQMAAYGPTFRRRVNEMAAAVDRRPAVFMLELDAIGSSSCVRKRGSLSAWEADLRYEMDKMQALPHTVVYVEGGYSDSNTIPYVARVLRAIDIHRIRGIFTNDTHEQWTINEVRYATRLAELTHGTHFIVDTADNGRGPLLNPHPRTQGVENLCNPPGRGLGIRDTTDTGYRYADAFMWTHPPGNSSGCGGGPSGGTFWPARAIQLAENANDQLGPGFPSSPY